MDESIKYLKEQFQLEDIDIRTYSPLTLAYIGDCVYELFVRTYLIHGANLPVKKLHKAATAMVNAKAQSDLYKRIEEMLTDEEMAELEEEE